MSVPGVYVDLRDLAGLQFQTAGMSLRPHQAVHSLLSGRRASRMRGRGLDFEEIRGYLPGDDIRSIDWRVTARTGEPHVRVYTEERDRPVLLVVDQRISMFWGTALNMKSVAAAEVAALLAWTALGGDDRVGGLVFDDDTIAEVRPQRSRAAVMQLLRQVVDRNAAMEAASAQATNPSMLDRALASAERIVGHDYLVVVISDFDVDDSDVQKRLLRMARNNDVIGVLVHDPSATDLPAVSDLVISDGELQVELPGGAHQRMAEWSNDRIANVLDWQRTIGVPILPLSCGEPTADQLRHLLGLRAERAAMNRLQLADIVEPATIPWTPQTIGWLILLLLAGATMGTGIAIWLRRRAANRYRREALAAIDALPLQSPDAINAVLKRTALTAYGRESVAALCGNEWVEFLNATSDTTADAACAEALAEGVYARRRGADDHVTTYARAWIRTHDRNAMARR